MHLRTYLLTFLLLVAHQVSAGTTLTSTTNTSTGNFTLSYTTTDPTYYTGHLSVYENGVYIGYTTNGALAISGRTPGSYSYYLRNCYPGGCYDNSNTVTVTIPSIGIVLTPSGSTNSSGDFTLSFTTDYFPYYTRVYESGNLLGNIYGSNSSSGNRIVSPSRSYSNGVYTVTMTITDPGPGSHPYHVTICNPGGCYQNSNTLTYPLANERRVVFIHTDLLGSPAAETDEQGNVPQ
jgi:hypothetical protein